MDILKQDIRHAFRALVAKPGFTAVALLTLAVGIGANTAIFSVVNAVLLRPLPFREPERLVALESVNLEAGALGFGGLAPADFWDFHDQSRTLDLALYGGSAINLMGERPESVACARVSSNFFDVFGVGPSYGRTFVAEEGLLNAPRAVVLSYRFWQRRYGGDHSVIGQTVQTDEGSITVIGVMPPHFKYPSYAEAWTPIARDGGEMKRRSTRYMMAVGRLRPGQTIQAAQLDADEAAAGLEQRFPKENQGWTARVTRFDEYLVGDGRRALLVLMGAVGFVLLIACANVANLLLVRVASRRKEIAIRLALGASRWRLLRQLLVDSVLLSVAGGALGSLFAAWGVDAIVGLLPRYAWTFQALSNARSDVRVDGSVLVFALALSFVTGLLFGLIPGIRATREGINDSLKEARGTEAPVHQRVRSALVIAEVSLALVLLVGASLLIQSFVRLRNVELGYDPRGLITASIGLPVKDKEAFGRNILDKVRQVPGVESASLMSFATMGGINMPFNVEGNPIPSGDQTVRYSSITPEYFRTVNVPMRAGREFTEFDKSETGAVSIINETLARDFFPGEDPVGKKLVLVYLGRRQTREIVGIAADIKQDEPEKPTKPEIYVPFQQQPWFGAWVLVRSSVGDGPSLRSGLQQVISSVDPNRPPAKIQSIEEVLSDEVAAPRLYTVLLGAFAGMAMLLASIGIYGLVSYSVTLRTREIGIRMALGAERAGILRMVLAQGAGLAVVGVAVGLVASLALTRLIAGLLFGVTATDPATLISISALLVAVAVVASLVPARRATRVDPMIALRAE
jgi:putative ABC transport system permease protein